MNPEHPNGLHHVTAICGPAQTNLDFYAGLLGLRLVKRTINFDDPGTYHLYYGDGTGRPGTILTFFPWAHATRGRRGAGEIGVTAFAVPAASLPWWEDRLAAAKVQATRRNGHFGDGEVLRFADPDGMMLELVADDASPAGEAWAGSPVPGEHALRGFQGVRATLAQSEGTVQLLTEVLGFTRHGEEGNTTRYVAAASEGQAGRFIDLVVEPRSGRGSSGAGTVHHIAWRVPDDAAQVALRERLLGLGYQVSPVMERNYFRSIYFREPGGVLFEVATDAPGFAVDEPRESLGQDLKLPPWLEPKRAQIEAVLPTLTLPTAHQA